jgi:hypothetical protein
MALSMKKILLLIKQEVTSGTDAVPTAALNAILCRAATPRLINAEFVDRTFIRPYKGGDSKIAVGVHRMLECEVELAGSGAAGTAPKWAPLLKACGFAETLTASTSAVYDPVSSGEPTVTIYGYLDGLLFKMTGCKGNVSLDLTAKGIPVLKFKFLGEYTDPTDVAIPSGADFSGFTQPKTVGKLNTPTCSFFGTNVVMQSISVDLANDLSYRDLIGGGGPSSQDRNPTGSAVIELTTVATKNWAQAVKDGTTGAVSVVHGVVAGNIVQLDMPKIQINGEPSISDDASNAMLTVPFAVLPNGTNGNDEIKITVR